MCKIFASKNVNHLYNLHNIMVTAFKKKKNCLFFVTYFTEHFLNVKSLQYLWYNKMGIDIICNSL
jgi:hypothetical protein